MSGQRILTRDVAYQGIRDAVISGRLPPGEQVTEMVLAAEFGLSRTPLREAIQRLASEDLMFRQPNGTIHVAPLDVHVMEEIFDVQEALEGLIAATEARLRPNGLVNRLQSLCRYENSHVGPENFDTAVEYYLQFHTALVEHSSRRYLVRMLDGIQPLTERYFRLAPRVPGMAQYLGIMRSEHDVIAKAMDAGDPIWAEMAVKANVRSAKKILQEAFRSVK